MLIRKTFRFEASHILSKHPGKCSRLHGHSWVLHVFVKGPINPETGFVMDYAEISLAVKPLLEVYLDHYHLNDLAIYPSSENLLWWIGKRLLIGITSLPNGKLIGWSKLALEETCTSYCELTREEFDACS